MVTSCRPLAQLLPTPKPNVSEEGEEMHGWVWGTISSTKHELYLVECTLNIIRKWLVTPINIPASVSPVGVSCQSSLL